MKKMVKQLAVVLALVMVIGSPCVVWAESTDCGPDQALPIETQVTELLSDATVSGERLVKALGKIALAYDIKADVVQSYVLSLQKGTISDTDKAVSSLERLLASALVGEKLSASQKQQLTSVLSTRGNDDQTIDTYNFELNVTYFKQDNTSYCAPATAKQTVHYINQSSASQSTIAPYVGIYEDVNGNGKIDSEEKIPANYSGVGTKLIDYINQQQSQNYYFYENIKNQGLTGYLLQYRIDTALLNYAPVVFNIWASQTPYWPYSTSGGHFLNISGEYNYGASYRFTDPFYQYYASSTSGKHTQTLANTERYANCIGW